MATFLLTTGFLLLFIVLMSVRMLLLEKGEFRGTCATQNPFLQRKGLKCGCGKEPGTCDNATQDVRSAKMPQIGKSVTTI